MHFFLTKLYNLNRGRASWLTFESAGHICVVRNLSPPRHRWNGKIFEDSWKPFHGYLLCYCCLPDTIAPQAFLTFHISSTLACCHIEELHVECDFPRSYVVEVVVWPQVSGDSRVTLVVSPVLCSPNISLASNSSFVHLGANVPVEFLIIT